MSRISRSDSAASCRRSRPVRYAGKPGRCCGCGCLSAGIAVAGELKLDRRAGLRFLGGSDFGVLLVRHAGHRTKRFVGQNRLQLPGERLPERVHESSEYSPDLLVADVPKRDLAKLSGRLQQNLADCRLASKFRIKRFDFGVGHGPFDVQILLVDELDSLQDFLNGNPQRLAIFVETRNGSSNSPW